MDQFMKVAKSWKKHRAINSNLPEASSAPIKQKSASLNSKRKKRDQKLARKMKEQSLDLLASEDED
jgi:hypothetical protein